MRPGGPKTLDSRNIFKSKVGGRARGALNLKQRRVSGPTCKVASQAHPSNSRNSFGASNRQQSGQGSLDGTDLQPYEKLC